MKFLIREGVDIRLAIFSKYVGRDKIDFLLSKIVPMESDYSIKSALYKLLPNDHFTKKIIDRVIESRALTTQRLLNNVVHSDIIIACHDYQN